MLDPKVEDFSQTYTKTPKMSDPEIVAPAEEPTEVSSAKFISCPTCAASHDTVGELQAHNIQKRAEAMFYCCRICAFASHTRQEQVAHQAAEHGA